MTNQTFWQFDINIIRGLASRLSENEDVFSNHVEDCSVPELVKVSVFVLIVAKSCHIVE